MTQTMAGMHVAANEEQQAYDSEGSYETEEEEEEQQAASEEAAAAAPVTAAQINKLKKKKKKRVNRFDASSQYNRKTEAEDKKSGIFGLGLSNKTKIGIGLGAGLAAAAGGVAAHQYYQKTHETKKTDGASDEGDHTEESTEVELDKEEEIVVSAT